MNDCIFCKIVKGEIPSTKVYEDEYVLAFQDLEPQMPVHILVIPKKHIESVAHVKEDDEIIIGKIFTAINKIAHNIGIDQSGFRVISNSGEHAGQTVKHLHFHVLGGKQMNEKII